MDTPADVTFWAFVTTVVIGVTTAALGWLRRGRAMPEEPARSIHGAAIVDSSAVSGLVDAVLQLKASHDAKVKEQAQTVKVMERQAAALEALVQVEVERDKRKAAERHDSELETLRREIEDLKRGKR